MSNLGAVPRRFDPGSIERERHETLGVEPRLIHQSNSTLGGRSAQRAPRGIFRKRSSVWLGIKFPRG
jgi:hypothetical protein